MYSVIITDNGAMQRMQKEDMKSHLFDTWYPSPLNSKTRGQATL